MSNVLQLWPESRADELERLARRPLQARRDWLLWLADRVRALDAIRARPIEEAA